MVGTVPATVQAVTATGRITCTLDTGATVRFSATGLSQQPEAGGRRLMLGRPKAVTAAPVVVPETKKPETKKPETKKPETKKPEPKKPEPKKPETKPILIVPGIPVDPASPKKVEAPTPTPVPPPTVRAPVPVMGPAEAKSRSWAVPQKYVWPKGVAPPQKKDPRTFTNKREIKTGAIYLCLDKSTTYYGKPVLLEGEADVPWTKGVVWACKHPTRKVSAKYPRIITFTTQLAPNISPTEAKAEAEKTEAAKEAG